MYQNPIIHADYSDPDYLGKDPKRQWTGVTLCVEADGDNVYKSAVQELNVQVYID